MRHRPIYTPWPGPTRWKHINGGGLIGRANEIMAFVRKVWTTTTWCNQFAYNRWLILHPEEFEGRLDYHCSLWCNLFTPGGQPSASSALEVRDGRLYNKETGRFPCLIHGNGGTADQAEWLWDAMKRTWQ